MRYAASTFALAVVMTIASSGTSAIAGYCGGDSYNCCPQAACAASGDYCEAKSCCSTCYKTVKETIYEQQEVTCTKTVYDTVCEKVPVKCWKNVYETHYRDECYTVCKPVYKTCYRNVTCKSRRPVYKTCYREVCCTKRRPVYKTCYREVNYTTCKPATRPATAMSATRSAAKCRNALPRRLLHLVQDGSEDCYRDECYTVCTPITGNQGNRRLLWRVANGYGNDSGWLHRTMRVRARTWECDPCTVARCTSPAAARPSE